MHKNRQQSKGSLDKPLEGVEGKNLSMKAYISMERQIEISHVYF